MNDLGDRIHSRVHIGQSASEVLNVAEEAQAEQSAVLNPRAWAKEGVRLKVPYFLDADCGERHWTLLRHPQPDGSGEFEAWTFRMDTEEPPSRTTQEFKQMTIHDARRFVSAHGRGCAISVIAARNATVVTTEINGIVEAITRRPI